MYITDEQWRQMIQDALIIRRRIMESGKMATKTIVEDELIPMHNIDRGLAHSVMNHIEYHNLR